MSPYCYRCMNHKSTCTCSWITLAPLCYKCMRPVQFCAC